MRIVMMTNTYLPHVGGVARSVQTFGDALRAKGHQVMVVAPDFPGTPERETDTVRVPALQRFNGSDFSVRLPVPGLLDEPLDRFQGDLVHSHHPFLLGDTALRVASGRGLPLVFTHHTLYEEYTHYVSTDSEALRRFVIDLSTGYANLCDHVVAPSGSIAALLRERGVTAPITVIPTGIDLSRYADPAPAAFRKSRGIPVDAFVAGHTGRLAPEKNLALLTRAAAEFLRARPSAWFLVAGTGPLREEMERMLGEAGVLDRCRFEGVLQGRDLIDCYAAMDAFAFASKSETQGMVLMEAMAAGVPVIAIDASGVRDVVEDGINGRLLRSEDPADLAAALENFAALPPEGRARFAEGAKRTARSLSREASADKLIAVYGGLVRRKSWQPDEDDLWHGAMRRIQAEWRLLENLAHAAGSAIVEAVSASVEPGEEDGEAEPAAGGRMA
jgi:1,2-diacylglycerol 3-alpha-glucosyltransferase